MKTFFITVMAILALTPLNSLIAKMNYAEIMNEYNEEKRKLEEKRQNAQSQEDIDAINKASQENEEHLKEQIKKYDEEQQDARQEQILKENDESNWSPNTNKHKDDDTHQERILRENDESNWHPNTNTNEK